MSNKNFFLAAAAVILAVFITPNVRSLVEGIFFYLRDAAAYSPNAVQSIQRDGRYASLYDLVPLRNAERYNYLLTRLQALNVAIVPIPIPNYPFPNLFVQFNHPGPYMIYSAHYDKLFDDPNYQGASDNTAAVSVLLASIAELARRDADGSRRAFLFTGAEEVGLHGAVAFVNYARTTPRRIAIREIVNFDNLGRGQLAIRPSAEIPGFVFTIPLFGDLAYDGREFRASPAYPLANARLTQALLRAQPEMTLYQRFTAVSDSNIFQANDIDTVAISGADMHYLELTWHTYADRVELLDERNLDLAFELIMRYGSE